MCRRRRSRCQRTTRICRTDAYEAGGAGDARGDVIALGSEGRAGVGGRRHPTGRRLWQRSGAVARRGGHGGRAAAAVPLTDHGRTSPVTAQPGRRYAGLTSRRVGGTRPPHRVPGSLRVGRQPHRREPLERRRGLASIFAVDVEVDAAGPPGTLGLRPVRGTSGGGLDVSPGSRPRVDAGAYGAVLSAMDTRAVLLIALAILVVAFLATTAR